MGNRISAIKGAWIAEKRGRSRVFEGEIEGRNRGSWYLQLCHWRSIWGWRKAEREGSVYRKEGRNRDRGYLRFCHLSEAESRRESSDREDSNVDRYTYNNKIIGMFSSTRTYTKLWSARDELARVGPSMSQVSSAGLRLELSLISLWVELEPGPVQLNSH